MKIYKKVISLLLMGGLAINMGGCSSKKIDNIDMSLEEMVDLNSDNTYLDDVNKEITLKEGEKLNIIKASDVLEENIKIKQLLDSVEISSYSDVELVDSYLSLEEVEKYIESFNSLDDESLKRLYSLKVYIDKWLNDNTYNITEELLLTSIKTTVAPLIYSDSEDYEKITISSNYDPMKGTLEYYDEELKSDVSLSIDIDSYVYKDMTSLYSLQTYDESDSLNYDNVLDVLNQNKYLLGEDLEIDGDYIISNTNEKEIVKHLQK